MNICTVSGGGGGGGRVDGVGGTIGDGKIFNTTSSLSTTNFYSSSSSDGLPGASSSCCSNNANFLIGGGGRGGSYDEATRKLPLLTLLTNNKNNRNNKRRRIAGASTTNTTSSNGNKKKSVLDDDVDHRHHRNGGSSSNNKNLIFDEKDLVKEMNELSFQEREKVYDDLHGVATPMLESEEFIKTAIEAFDKALTKIPKMHQKALDKAIFLRPRLLQDDLKLMFLRAEEDYNAMKAAKRLCKHYTVKLDIFGDTMIAKDIRLSDLTSEDINASILSGSTLCLEQKDQVGRPIFVFDVTKFDHYKAMSHLRSTFYLCMTTLLENEIAQTKGIANLTYSPTKRSNPAPFGVVSASLQKSGNMISSIPVRVTGYHYCTDDAKMNFILSSIRMTYGKQVRLRTRTHFGSDLEMQYSLLTFGINCSTILSCGEGKTELHDDYIERRRRIEVELDEKIRLKEIETGIVEYPTPDDVLIGRGRPYHEYVGTRKLIQLIDSKLVEYYKYDSTKSSSTSTEDRFWKTCINTDIVTMITESGGRFLQRVPNVGWKILNSTVAREKTSNLFRYRNNSINK